MRSARRFGALSGVLALALTARAAPPGQEYKFEERVITAPKVEVRSGPSNDPKMYPTCELHRGDRVEAVTNKDGVPAGWLAIKPPAGSFSWVNVNYVSTADAHSGTVTQDDTPVLVGSALYNQPPSVNGPRLQRGTQVIILDRFLQASDGSKWFPIAPHTTEVRYIPADAVSASAGVATVSAKPANSPVETRDFTDPVYLQAVQAEKAGKLADAVRLYQQAGTQTSDAELRLVCNNRADALQRQLTGAAAAATAPAPEVPAVGKADWSPPGRLARTDLQLDGKPLYRLYDDKNQAVMYVIASPGISLDQYLDRYRVHLYGLVTYRGDSGIRLSVMTASYLKMIQ